METCFCCVSLWMVNILFRIVSAEPASPPHYTIHHTPGSFDQAVEACSPGVVTTLATEHEVNNILRLIYKSISLLNQSEFTFWVGLRKPKNECVDPVLPLKGFKWTEDGSQETQVSRWLDNPKDTCTTILCAVLQGKFNGSTPTIWGLSPVSCKKSYSFICKLREPLTGTRKPSKPATTPEAKPAKPAQPEPEPHETDPPSETQQPKIVRPEHDLSTQEPQPDAKQKPETTPGSAPEPAAGPRSCERPNIPSFRSLTPDPNNTIQVECWSSVKVEIRCLGHPAVWRLLDNSPANFTTICDPCEGGYQKESSGGCVDIDECAGSPAPCRSACLNTAGSYRCVCSDETGNHHDEDSPLCKDSPTTGENSLLSGVLFPVLVAVAALVVLVVLVAVIVKCCLMRRAKKKEEKMAMKSKDNKNSFETANEKVAI